MATQAHSGRVGAGSPQPIGPAIAELSQTPWGNASMGTLRDGRYWTLYDLGTEQTLRSLFVQTLFPSGTAQNSSAMTVPPLLFGDRPCPTCPPPPIYGNYREPKLTPLPNGDWAFTYVADAGFVGTPVADLVVSIVDETLAPKGDLETFRVEGIADELLYDATPTASGFAIAYSIPFSATLPLYFRTCGLEGLCSEELTVPDASLGWLRLSPLSNESFALFWPNPSGVWAQRAHNNGTLLNLPTLLINDLSSDRPELACGPNGTIAFAYPRGVELRQLPDFAPIHESSLNATGTPSVRFLDDGSWMVLWPSGNSVWGRRFSPMEETTDPFLLASQHESVSAPLLAPSGLNVMTRWQEANAGIWSQLFTLSPVVAHPIPTQRAIIERPFVFTPEPSTFAGAEEPFTYEGATNCSEISYLSDVFRGTPTTFTPCSALYRAIDTLGHSVETAFLIQTENNPPYLNRPLVNHIVEVNQSFSFSLPADTFVDPDGHPLILKASPLPPGITFEAETFSGTPTELGLSPITVSATDGFSQVNSSFSLDVVRAPSVSQETPPIPQVVGGAVGAAATGGALAWIRQRKRSALLARYPLSRQVADILHYRTGSFEKGDGQTFHFGVEAIRKAVVAHHRTDIGSLSANEWEMLSLHLREAVKTHSVYRRTPLCSPTLDVAAFLQKSHAIAQTLLEKIATAGLVLPSTGLRVSQGKDQTVVTVAYPRR